MARGNDMGITEVSKGVYLVRPYIGKDPLSGKYIRAKAQTVKGTKAQARAVRDDMVERAKGGLVVDAARMTFAQVANGWYASVEISGKRPSTLNYYRRMKDVCCCYLGGVKVTEITPDTLNRALALIKAEHGYSGSSMKHAFKTMSAILRYAEDNDYIRKNPCRKMKAPEASTEEARALTESESVRLLECAEVSARKMMADYLDKESRSDDGGRSYLRGFGAMGRLLSVRIALATGMRRGEIAALTWGRVDFDTNRITVVASLSAEGQLGPTKSKKGRRCLPVNASTMDALRRWRSFQAGQLLKLGIVQDDATPVCTSEVGGFMDLRRFNRWWSDWSSENGFEGLRFHDIRHTVATLLLMHGVPVKVVSEFLGHSSVDITMKIYAHVLEGTDEIAAVVLDDVLSGKGMEMPGNDRINHFLTTYSRKGTAKETGQPLENVG